MLFLEFGHFLKPKFNQVSKWRNATLKGCLQSYILIIWLTVPVHLSVFLHVSWVKLCRYVNLSHALALVQLSSKVDEGSDWSKNKITLKSCSCIHQHFILFKCDTRMLMCKRKGKKTQTWEWNCFSVSYISKTCCETIVVSLCEVFWY